MTTYGYTRVSTVEQADGSSLDDQARKIAGTALIRNEEVARVFEDAGVSGSVPLNERPAGAQLLEVLQPGDTLIVAKLDRAFRNATDALVLSDWFKAKKVKLILTDMGTDPVTENGTSRIFFGVLALMAEFERSRILERTDDGRKAKRARGGHTGGSRPFGYNVIGQGRDAQLVPVPEEQDAIKHMRAAASLGMSLRAIAGEVNSQYNVKVSHETVRRVISTNQE